MRAGGVAIGCLVLLERLLMPAVAYVAFRVGLGLGAAMGAGMVLVLTLRANLQSRLLARSEADLYASVVTAVLAGDVLNPGIAPNKEARPTLLHGMHQLARLVAETVPHFVANLLAATILAGALAALEPLRVTMAAVVALLFGAVILLASRKRIADAYDGAWEAWRGLAARLDDACDARFDLVAAGREGDFTADFVRSAEAWGNRTWRAQRVGGLLGRLPIGVAALAIGAAVVGDALRSGASWSEAGVRAGLLVGYTPVLLGLARCLQDLTSHAERLSVVDHALNAPALSASGGALPAQGPKLVVLDAVRFSYGVEGAEALAGVSFTWRAGETLVLVGANGSGKSTVLRALLGLRPCSGGAIHVDGVALSRLNLACWRRRVAFLPQRPYFPPHATVRQALAFLEPACPDEALRASLREVGLTHPPGTDPLEDRVASFSVGERQRIALARVLCSSAPLVVLDEPDANLDREGIARVAGIVARLAHEKMLLVVAHTVEIERVADRTVTLERGRVRSDDMKRRPRMGQGA
jgi:ABC-type multidrug transport system fused ATPase/permease subunit